ncbi:MAG: glycosyltransferase family 39 protein [Acidobacteriia bacterium]|nr:glycosyltransferase family 39 protein [Terriglobia bacterium]
MPALPTTRKWLKFSRHLFLGIGVLYLLLASSAALTTAPFPNEAWFASPALNLYRHGFMGTTILESTGTWFAGIDRHTYWVPPGYFLVQAVWYWCFGPGLIAARASSLLFGLLVLYSTYCFTRRLSGSRAAGFIASLLLASDYRFVHYGANGRMDMMCAGLGFAGLAAYLGLRKRSFPLALAIGHGLASASCLTHACGVLYAVGLLLLILFLDRENLKVKWLFLVAAPYLLGLAAWGVYIAKDPGSFRSQFLGNVSGISAELGKESRFSGLRQPVQALRHEVGSRYLANFGRWAKWGDPLGQQLAVLALYIIGIAGAILIPRLFHHTGTKLLMTLGAAFGLIFWLLEGTRTSAYLVHTMPVGIAIVAIGLRWWPLAFRREIIIVVVTGACLLNTFALAREFQRDARGAEYEPVARYMQQHIRPGKLVMASGAFGFRLGFSGEVLDDVRLGQLSGKQPDWVIQSKYYAKWAENSVQREPEIAKAIQQRLSRDFRPVFHNDAYTVYRSHRLP